MPEYADAAEVLKGIIKAHATRWSDTIDTMASGELDMRMFMGINVGWGLQFMDDYSQLAGIWFSRAAANNGAAKPETPAPTDGAASSP